MKMATILDLHFDHWHKAAFTPQALTIIDPTSGIPQLVAFCNSNKSRSTIPTSGVLQFQLVAFHNAVKKLKNCNAPVSALSPPAMQNNCLKINLPMVEYTNNG